MHNDSHIESFKQIVIKASENQNFIHHLWFVEYHLKIVEKIALELLEYYPEADAEIVRTLVWLHDYGKTLDFDKQYEMTLTEGPEALRHAGFDEAFIKKVMGYMETIDKKMEVDLNAAPIEVKIVSSADGCSHFVGPFMSLWWRENSKKDFKELMADNTYKANKDWTRKIVLPEARAAFEGRRDFSLEQSGAFPERFIPKA